MKELAQDAKSVKWVGIGLIVFGVLSILSPLLTGLAIAISVGVCTLFIGILRLTFAFQAERGKARTHGILGGALVLIVGLILVAAPGLGLSLFAMILAIAFGLEGLARIALALQVKPADGWGMAMFSGVVTLMLGLMIFMQWPLSGAWALGTVVGVWAIFTGWALYTAGATVQEAG